VKTLWTEVWEEAGNAGAEELGAEEHPLFLPTPSFTASAEEEYVGDRVRFPLFFLLYFLSLL